MTTTQHSPDANAQTGAGLLLGAVPIRFRQLTRGVET